MATNDNVECYKYTKDNFFMTKAQRDFYEYNGYLIIPKLVDENLLEECKQRFLDICNGIKLSHGPLIVMKDLSLKSKNAKGEHLIDKIQDFAHDEVLFKYICYKPIVDIVSSIIGPNITTIHNMLINKPPNADQAVSKHPLHQDLHFFPIRPANSLVASWTAMEHIDEKNGCLYAIPGSHKADLKYHDYPSKVKNIGYHEVFGFEDVPKVNLVMEKGDTVFIHPLLVHGSGPNVTKGFRKAISTHYVDSNCSFINVKGTTREKIGREIEALYSKIFGTRLTYKDAMKMKSRLVRGSPGNFQAVGSHL